MARQILNTLDSRHLGLADKECARKFRVFSHFGKETEEAEEDEEDEE